MFLSSTSNAGVRVVFRLAGYSNGFSRVVIVLFVCMLVLPTSARVNAGWRNVVTHPVAIRQPTAVGRSLVELQRVADSIYIGYGDYAANTGPIDVYSWSAPFRRLRSLGLRLNTEAILNYRNIGSRVFVISADPENLRLHNFASARVDRSTQWSRGRVGSVASASHLHAAHLYDVAWFDGSLWAAGGMTNNHAGLWRSWDSGRSWTLANSIAPRSGSSTDLARFYFIGVLRKKLYVQGYDYCGGSGCSHPASQVFDGVRWRSGPDLLNNHGMGYAPVKFRDGLVMRSYENAFYPSRLLAFDGRRVRDPVPWQQKIHDFAVAQDGYLYVLTADISPHDGVNDQHVLRTRDLDRWECIFDAPRSNSARSIEVVRVVSNSGRLLSKVFVGTTHSSLAVRWVQDRANCDGKW